MTYPRHAPHRLGAHGESVAAQFLQRRGAEIIDRNVALDSGELDLIVSLGGRKIAVEVKSGSGDVDPLVHFDSKKRSQVQQLARRLSCRRIDVIVVRFKAEGIWVRWLQGV